jgi:DNA-binding NarL/FixJ family response regulator
VVSTASIRVVLGEDSYLAREAITAVLARVREVELVASCEDLDSLRRAIDETQPDVVLTDIRMPPTRRDEGVRLAHELRSTHPEVGVVVLSQFVEPAYAARLFEGGSARRAYLIKERVKDREELVRTLRTVAAGGSAIDPVVVEELLMQRRTAARDDGSTLPALSPRELQVLGLIAQGKSNAAIADELVVTKRAVERHVNNIFAKLGLPEAEDVSRRVRAALLFLMAQDEH